MHRERKMAVASAQGERRSYEEAAAGKEGRRGSAAGHVDKLQGARLCSHHSQRACPTGTEPRSERDHGFPRIDTPGTVRTATKPRLARL